MSGGVGNDDAEIQERSTEGDSTNPITGAEMKQRTVDASQKSYREETAGRASMQAKGPVLLHIYSLNASNTYVVRLSSAAHKTNGQMMNDAPKMSQNKTKK
jgi:hypothetical protein